MYIIASFLLVLAMTVPVFAQTSNSDDIIPALHLIINDTDSVNAGIISYRLASGGVYLIRPQAGATPIDVSARLDSSFSAGDDSWLNISPNGEWLLLETERFGCTGWACLARVSIDFTQGETVGTGANLVHSEGFSAIDSTGNLVVYSSTDGPHDVDLYAITRVSGVWGTPLLLTQSSTFSRNEQPAISEDGHTTLFNCRNFEEPTTASICEVGTDGSGFRVVTTPSDTPAGVTTVGQALHQPDYALQGNIVYEGDWGGEAIYTLPAGQTTPVRVNAQYNNDNSPCVLPTGVIASLWLDRPGGQGVHELKIMDADGQNGVVLLQDIDVFDLGLGCGKDMLK
ncbi:hypothetical protein [Desulfovibrio inopinatus]|uniref:hypothetical protein n=1 Tax=Desulfovibrio inopinatus TaxID=102109 RepID=UPI0003F8052A|nr:hypothetical protein [Desulfovibrio inopinatus]